MKDSSGIDSSFQPIKPSIQQWNGSNGNVNGCKFAIIVSQYHLNITGNLLHGAINTLQQHNVPDTNIEVFWVPGAWELVHATKMVLQQNKFDAILTFGCVIRGETSHDQHINTTVSNSFGRLTLEYNAPIAFGLLTCNTLDQAIARAGGDVGNKGVEVAKAAIQMLVLQQEILG